MNKKAQKEKIRPFFDQCESLILHLREKATPASIKFSSKIPEESSDSLDVDTFKDLAPTPGIGWGDEDDTYSGSDEEF